MTGKIKDKKRQIVNWQYKDNVIKINIHSLRYTDFEACGLVDRDEVIKVLDDYIGVSEVIE